MKGVESRTNISLVTPSKKRRKPVLSKTNNNEQWKAHEELRDLFMLFDSDNDGFISFIDLKNALMSLGEYESDHGIEDMMRKLFSSSEVNSDIRSMVIDFERFAQVFMYYHVNDEELDEDDEVLIALSNSPTTAAISSSHFVSGGIAPKKDVQSVDSPNPTPKAKTNPALARVRNNATSNLSRRRNDSLTSAYELSELIGEESDIGEDDEEDEPRVEQQKVVKEEITLDEFVNRQVFRVLDLDGNGSITIGELKDLVLRYCPNDVADELDEDRLIDMLHLIDINSDGQVQYEEFLKLIGLSDDKRYTHED